VCGGSLSANGCRKLTVTLYTREDDRSEGAWRVRSSREVTCARRLARFVTMDPLQGHIGPSLLWGCLWHLSAGYEVAAPFRGRVRKAAIRREPCSVFCYFDTIIGSSSIGGVYMNRSTSPRSGFPCHEAAQLPYVMGHSYRRKAPLLQ
jgi:hypothetical protein